MAKRLGDGENGPEAAFREVVLPELQEHSLPHLGIEPPDDEELQRLWHDYISGHWTQAARDFVARYVLDLLYLNGRTLADSHLADGFIRRLDQPVLEGHPIKGNQTAAQDYDYAQSGSIVGIETGEQLIAFIKKNSPTLCQQMEREVWKDNSSAYWGNVYLASSDDPIEAIDNLRQHLKNTLAEKQATITPVEEEEKPEGDEDQTPEEYVTDCCKQWIDGLNKQLEGAIPQVPLDKIQETRKVNAGSVAEVAHLNELSLRLTLDQVQTVGIPQEEIQSIWRAIESEYPLLIDHPLFEKIEAAPALDEKQSDESPTGVSEADSLEDVEAPVEQCACQVDHDRKDFGISSIGTGEEASEADEAGKLNVTECAMGEAISEGESQDVIEEVKFWAKKFVGRVNQEIGDILSRRIHLATVSSLAMNFAHCGEGAKDSAAEATYIQLLKNLDVAHAADDRLREYFEEARSNFENCDAIMNTPIMKEYVRRVSSEPKASKPVVHTPPSSQQGGADDEIGDTDATGFDDEEDTCLETSADYDPVEFGDVDPQMDKNYIRRRGDGFGDEE